MSDQQNIEVLQEQPLEPPTDSDQISPLDAIASMESVESAPELSEPQSSRDDAIDQPEASGQPQQLTEPVEDNAILQESDQDFQSFSKRLRDRLEGVIQENEKLKRENLELHQAIQQRDSKMAEVEERFSELLGTLSELNRNRTATYVSGDRPQNHLLVHEFIQLKDQDFQFVSTLMFHWLSEQREDLKRDRKCAIAAIKFMLSEHVLMQAMNLTTMEHDTAIATVFKSISTTLINSGDGEFSSMPHELHQALENLIQRGIELVGKMTSADPPGTLWMDKEGTQFDSEQHQPLLGYQSSGDIHFTVYPGYRAGNRIFEKACVFTEKDT